MQDMSDSKRRQAITQLIELLPTHLRSRFGMAERLGHEEPDLECLGQAFNCAVREGSLSRRQFIQAAGIIMSAGLGAALIPRSAQAYGYNLGAFWKKRAGIVTSGLVALLDAGDAASYDGSSQTWKNVVTSPADSSSQSAYDFYRGSGSGSDGADPTFVGIAGGRSANDYFSFDGGDYFTLAGSNTTFVNSLHQSGANFTLIAVVAFGDTNNNIIFGTGGSTSGNYQGVIFQFANSQLVLSIRNQSNSTVLQKTSDQSFATQTIHYVAVSLDTSSTGFLYANGNYAPVSGSNTWTAAYSSPTNSSSVQPTNIGCTNGYDHLKSGSRLALLQFYNRTLSKAELDQNFSALRSRFGI